MHTAPIALVMIVGVAMPCAAQGLDRQQAALDLIRATATDICTTVPTRQTNQTVELTGSAKAKLAGIVGKVADLGIEGAAKYATGSSRGVLQKDLATAIRDGNNCKLSVLGILTPRLLPVFAAPPPPKPKSPAAPARGPALRLQIENLRQIDASIGPPPTIDGHRVNCDSVALTVLMAHAAGNRPVRISSVAVVGTPVSSPARVACTIDPLSSHPHGIVLVNSYIISTFDDRLAARFIENASTASAVDPANLLIVGGRSRAVTLVPGEPPVGFDLLIEAKSDRPQQITVRVTYDDNGEKSATVGPIYLAR